MLQQRGRDVQKCARLPLLAQLGWQWVSGPASLHSSADPGRPGAIAGLVHVMQKDTSTTTLGLRLRLSHVAGGSDVGSRLAASEPCCVGTLETLPRAVTGEQPQPINPPPVSITLLDSLPGRLPVGSREPGPAAACTT